MTDLSSQVSLSFFKGSRAEVLQAFLRFSEGFLRGTLALGTIFRGMFFHQQSD